MLERKINDIFEEFRSFKTRDSIGMFHDEVRPAMFEKELASHLSKSEIKEALKMGLIKPIKISDYQGCIKNAYLCTSYKMPQVSFLKKAVAFLFA